MLFTVFQYIPILEEETRAHSTELAKKAGEDDSNGNDDVESDSDVDDALNSSFIFNFNMLSSKTTLRATTKKDYNSFFQKITIPPPKA